MSLKDWWRGLCNSFKKSNMPKAGDFQPEVNEHGLISGHEEEHEGVGPEVEGEEKSISLKKEGRGDKREAIERLEDGFNSLVEQLKGINSNLESQSERHSELMGQMNRLGELIEKFPSVV